MIVARCRDQYKYDRIEWLLRKWRGLTVGGKAMTGTESRLLHVGARVGWQASTTDLGTVIGNNWSCVEIKWDNGRTGTIHHNDMSQIECGPRKKK